QRRYATLDPGKSRVRGGASEIGPSGPTSDHLTPSFSGWPENRLKVSMPIPGFTRTSSISVGRTTVVACSVRATTDEEKRMRIVIKRMCISGSYILSLTRKWTTTHLLIVGDSASLSPRRAIAIPALQYLRCDVAASLCLICHC